MGRLIFLVMLNASLLSACSTISSLNTHSKSTATPLAQTLKLRPDLQKELATVEVRQYFNRAESPNAAEVKVTETELLDDSVKAIRTIYSYKLVDQQWQLSQQKQEFQCIRGKNKNKFQTAKCT